MASGIKGKVAVITGGASGIGKATALAFAREGANVVIATARSIEAAQEVVAQIEQLGGEAIYIQCDVTNEAQVEAMVAKAVAEFGRIDFAFNNAGVGPEGVTIPFAPIAEMAEADWDKVIDTNLKGVFLCMKHELRQMRSQGSGTIVNTSSTAALGAKAAFGAYCPSKAGVVVVSKVAALENKDLGIRVNVVCPGPTKGTGMSDRLLSSMAEAGPGGDAPGGPPGGGDLLAVMGEPDDVARVVIWLCSDEASFVNGNVLSVDGGLDIS
jgi:NAD(P)-dependent dehydrogenase (short-subunit alcohol dehydrogenase family)